VLLLAGNGNGSGNAGTGNNGGNGPGDGTGNAGIAPADGTGNGPGPNSGAGNSGEIAFIRDRLGQTVSSIHRSFANKETRSQLSHGTIFPHRLSDISSDLPGFKGSEGEDYGRNIPNISTPWSLEIPVITRIRLNPLTSISGGASLG
jgi:hypothetical protein